MPRHKKVDKQKKEEIVLDLRQDREEFLRAFEKPTQIYRFLRARHCISPVFLHRTLSYMLDRCSRNNARRKKFHVDDMLQVSEFNNLTSTAAAPLHYDQLKLTISGFYVDPGVHQEHSLGKKLRIIEAEVSVRKALRCRRKDAESLETEEVVGSVDVPVNPRNPDNYEEDPIIINTTDIYHTNEGQTIKNYSLVFRVYEPTDEYSEGELSDNSLSDNEMEEDCESVDGRKRKRKDDPAAISLRNLTTGRRRRRKQNDESEDDDNHETTHPLGPPRKLKKMNTERIQAAMYEAELFIFTSEKQNVLLDGEYELSLNRKYDNCVDGRRNATWESLDGGREVKVLSTMSNRPVLKFHLKWSENDKPGPLAELMSENKSSIEESDAKRARRRNTNKSTDENSNPNNNSNENPPVLPVDNVEYRKPRRVHKPKPIYEAEVNGNQDTKHLVYYQFIYNSETQQQTEARNDFYCPWCQLNCINLYGLIKHLKMVHPRFNFNYVSQNHGYCIEVSVNECYDGSYSGNPQFIFGHPGMAFSRRGPVRRVQVTDTLVYRAVKERKQSKLDINELLEKEENEDSTAAHYAAGHHRLYFHSETNVPVRPCEFDVDSEEEPDPDWLRNHIKRMLDEFTDVNTGEKPLMKLWNLYIMKHNCVADAQMYSSCRNFIDLYGSLISKQNLRRNLLLHFVTLVDFGVLKTSALLSLMKHYDQVAEEELKSRKPIINHVQEVKVHIKDTLLDSEAKNPPNATGKPREIDFYDLQKSTRLARLQQIIDNAQNTAAKKQE